MNYLYFTNDVNLFLNKNSPLPYLMMDAFDSLIYIFYQMKNKNCCFTHGTERSYCSVFAIFQTCLNVQ